MEYGLMDLVSLLGALGFFIYGMKVMSEGIQKVAGSKMREILSAMTSNRFKGVFTGFLLTALVQSSSATTVMVVSFVNAGLLNLTESIGVIMGANIGTTVTAWIISLIGFKVKISAYALPIIAIGAPLLFAKKSKPRAWGEVLIGFALLFMGLAALKGAVPDLKQNPEILAFLQQYTDMKYLSILIFVAIGSIVTLVVQSSSAAMAITLIMANQGWIPFELAAAMVLGENIGTTITANLAALIANVHAKRAARAHLIFNLSGVVWMLIVFMPFLHGISNYLEATNGVPTFLPEGVDAQSEQGLAVAAAIPIGLSIFHTLFNIINTFVMVWFLPKIAQLVIKMVPSKGDDEEFHLEFIGMNIMATPEISILEARKEIAKFAKITTKMSEFTRVLITKKQHKSRTKMMDKMKQYEEITDQLEVDIATFLAKVAEGNIREESSFQIRALLSNINDMERIGDIFYQISLTIERQLESEQWFSEEQISNLLKIYGLLDEALNIMRKNLNADYSKVTIDEALNKEREINAMRSELRRDYLMKLEKGEYHVKDAINYIELINGCEKVGDHVINVSEGVTGKI
ncbi:MAG: Na/Pi cotransporter family protein [Bacteroidetes bacterium]|nr:MAG: Na/Pi cotransporter family protein [Bacteroidota bacterium]